MDKSIWLEIKDNDYALPEAYELNTLTDELFSYLESPNPELRQDIALNILEQWIREKDFYSNSELEIMLEKLLLNLRKGIGEVDTDSLFLRSVSLWILTFILQRDIKVSFMTVSKFNELVEHIADYMRDEQDFRGWVEGKGWGHIVAHGASLLGVIVEHPHGNATIDERILMLIAEQMIRQTTYVYQAGEDDRMAQTAYIILKQNRVEITMLRQWLTKLESVMNLASAGMSFDIRVFNAYLNARNFVRALYFPIELCVPEKPAVWDELRPHLLDTIKEIGLC